MNRIRVAHIITKLELGGAQNVALYTAEHLDRGLFEVHLLCGRGGMQDDRARTLARSGAVRVRFISHLVREIRPWIDFMGFVEILCALVAIQPDIVHTHSSKAGVLGRMAAAVCRWFTGRPRVVVHTVHGFGFHARQAAPVRLLFQGLERACALATDTLVFVSRANRDQAAALGIVRPGREVLIRAGLPTAVFLGAPERRAPTRQLLGIDPDAFVVTTIGPFKPQKNHADFIRLAALLKDAAVRTGGRAPLFLIAGDGVLRPEIEALVQRLAVGDIVRLLGWCHDIPGLLGASDLFVMTSRWEGLPVAAVEALVAGVPVVAYRIDGLTDIISNGRNGFLVPPGDVHALAEAVQAIREDTGLRTRLKSGSKSSICDEFDRDRMVDRTQHLYLALTHRF